MCENLKLKKQLKCYRLDNENHNKIYWLKISYAICDNWGLY